MDLKNDIVIVGNGPSIFESEHGECIDEFGTIVRMNRLHISGNEKYIGTRTDIISCWNTGPISVELLRQAGAHTALLIPPKNHHVLIRHGFEKYKKEIEKARLTLLFADETFVESLEKEIGTINTSYWASTGALCVAFFLRQYDVVYTHGVDAFMTAEERSLGKPLNLEAKSMFYDRVQRLGAHSKEIQWEYYQRCIKQGRLFRLDSGCPACGGEKK